MNAVCDGYTSSVCFADTFPSRGRQFRSCEYSFPSCKTRDFSCRQGKSGVNTACIHEHFDAAYTEKIRFTYAT